MTNKGWALMNAPRSGQHAAISRRRALQAAGIAATTLVTTGFDQKATRAQQATPAVSDLPDLPDLTGVMPLPLRGERLATFES
jgi:hypothetical protein